ncbi:MAG TPA: hypothetical protein VFA83_21350 [Acidimicrobiales bacterium]|nr:hypothetical protein [Acidimicrobiales bacterium]
MGRFGVGMLPGESLADREEEEIGPKVACPFCDYLIPLRHAIGPQGGRKPLTCPSCLREVALPGADDRI